MVYYKTGHKSLYFFHPGVEYISSSFISESALRCSSQKDVAEAIFRAWAATDYLHLVLLLENSCWPCEQAQAVLRVDKAQSLSLLCLTARQQLEKLLRKAIQQ